MTYRPKDWEKIKAQLIAKLLEGFCAASYANGVEDGADAMLEELRKRGSRAGKFIHEDGFIKETPLIVIIPEDEE